MAYPTYSIQTIAYGVQEDCLFGIFNKGGVGAGSYVVKYIDIVPSAGFGAGPTPQKVELRMITSLTGGIDIPYVKRNTSSADLPSQLKIVRRPEQITNATGCALRSILSMPSLSEGFGALCGYGKLGSLHRGSGQYFGAFNYASKTTAIQPITLREGEGVTISSPSVSPAWPYTLYGSFAITSQTTGATYNIFTHLHPSDLAAARFAIYNGSGSGDTYYIERIEIGDVGKEVAQPFTQNVDAPYVRFTRFGSMDDGKVLTPIPRNSAYPVPSSLEVRRNFVTEPLIADTLYNSGLSSNELNSAVVATIPTFHRPGLFRKSLIGYGAYSDVGVQCLGSDIIGGFSSMHGFSSRIDMGIVIPPGQGFGIVAGNTCYMSEYYIEAAIVWIPEQPKASVIGGGSLIKGRV